MSMWHHISPIHFQSQSQGTLRAKFSLAAPDMKAPFQAVLYLATGVI